MIVLISPYYTFLLIVVMPIFWFLFNKGFDLVRDGDAFDEYFGL
jgi:hypothetical protein